MNFKHIAAAIALALVSGGALAHGYVEKPASRAYLCQLKMNTDCGSVQYEPQSIEQKKGFPNQPAIKEGELASASLPQFAPLNRQSISEWYRTDIKPGRNEFIWHNSAKHATTKWQYFITKQDWDVNKPLTRDAFELTPFCEVDGKGEVPGDRSVHSCNVPQRTGYQVIYAVWEINNTSNSFYQAIDVNFISDDEQGEVAEWSKPLSGAIYGTDLKKGDRVIARFIDINGQEVDAMRTTLEITDDEAGAAKQWSYDLAVKLNSTHSDIRAGVKTQNGDISPAYGTNNVYARADSRLQTVLVEINAAEPEHQESLTLSDAQASEIVNGSATVNFSAEVSGEVSLDVTLTDHAGTSKGYLKKSLNTGHHPLSLTLENVQPGHHILRYVALNPKNQVIGEGVQNLQLQAAPGGETGKYDFVFPEGIKSYKAGTVVLQPKDGHTYECKPFPYSGYCQQWTSSSNHFEPGVGSNWQDGWILKK